MRSPLRNISSMAGLALAVVLMAAAGHADDDGDKVLSGMSIVGNDEAPKSLVIVPWKSSELGETLEVSRALDDGRGAVDREVFERAVRYYEIRSTTDTTRSGPAH